MMVGTMALNLMGSPDAAGIEQAHIAFAPIARVVDFMDGILSKGRSTDKQTDLQAKIEGGKGRRMELTHAHHGRRCRLHRCVAAANPHVLARRRQLGQ